MTPPPWLLVILAIAILILSASVIVLVLRERRHQLQRRDICADQRPTMVPSAMAAPVECVRPDGHRSIWHEGDDGSRWTEGAEPWSA